MPSKRALWFENNLKVAVRAEQKGTMSPYKAAETYKELRRTIKNYLKTGSLKKVLGRETTLSEDQETKLISRIIRFEEIGLPVTPRILRRLVYKCC